MLKVLVVAEDHNLRFAVSRILGDHGFDVVTAANGDRGVFLFDREIPDFVIMDVTVTPEHDGIAITEKMRSLCPRARIIGLSRPGLSGLDPEQAALILGMDELIAKPIDPDELLHCVGQLRLASA